MSTIFMSTTKLQPANLRKPQESNGKEDAKQAGQVEKRKTGLNVEK